MDSAVPPPKRIRLPDQELSLTFDEKSVIETAKEEHFKMEWTVQDYLTTFFTNLTYPFSFCTADDIYVKGQLHFRAFQDQAAPTGERLRLLILDLSTESITLAQAETSYDVTIDIDNFGLDIEYAFSRGTEEDRAPPVTPEEEGGAVHWKRDLILEDPANSQRVNLEKNGIDLKLAVTVHIEKKWQEQKPAQKALERQAVPISKDLAGLLQCNELADATLKCADTEILCHRAILAARSSVFRAQFSANMLERKTGCVTIKDIHPEILRTLVNYIYTNSVDCGEDNHDKAVNLVWAADKYDLQGLKAQAAAIVVKGLTIQNCVEGYVQGQLLELAMLRDAAMDLICDHPEEVTETAFWKEKFLKDHADMVTALLLKMKAHTKGRG